jgi:hypothetical protein
MTELWMFESNLRLAATVPAHFCAKTAALNNPIEYRRHSGLNVTRADEVLLWLHMMGTNRGLTENGNIVSRRPLS